MAKPACAECGWIHPSDAAHAIGKFDPAGPIGYVSRLGGSVRPTRGEAEADYCNTRRAGGASTKGDES